MTTENNDKQRILIVDDEPDRTIALKISEIQVPGDYLVFNRSYRGDALSHEFYMQKIDFSIVWVRLIFTIVTKFKDRRIYYFLS